MDRAIVDAGWRVQAERFVLQGNFVEAERCASQIASAVTAMAVHREIRAAKRAFRVLRQSALAERVDATLAACDAIMGHV